MLESQQKGKFLVRAKFAFLYKEHTKIKRCQGAEIGLKKMVFNGKIHTIVSLD